jgi:tetratricopeptide (TPR) repeat protein
VIRDAPVSSDQLTQESPPEGGWKQLEEYLKLSNQQPPPDMCVVLASEALQKLPTSESTLRSSCLVWQSEAFRNLEGKTDKRVAEAAEKATLEDATNVAAHKAFGIAVEDLGKFVEAIIAFEKALGLMGSAPNDSADDHQASIACLKTHIAQCHKAHGVELYDKREFDDAFVEFDKSLALMREVPIDSTAEVKTWMAQCYIGSRKFDDAIELLQNVNADSPSYRHGWIVLGNAYGKVENWNSAADAYKHALDVSSTREEQASAGKSWQQALDSRPPTLRKNVVQFSVKIQTQLRDISNLTCIQPPFGASLFHPPCDGKASVGKELKRVKSFTEGKGYVNLSFEGHGNSLESMAAYVPAYYRAGWQLTSIGIYGADKAISVEGVLKRVVECAMHCQTRGARCVMFQLPSMHHWSDVFSGRSEWSLSDWARAMSAAKYSPGSEKIRMPILFFLYKAAERISDLVFAYQYHNLVTCDVNSEMPRHFFIGGDQLDLPPLSQLLHDHFSNLKGALLQTRDTLNLLKQDSTWTLDGDKSCNILKIQASDCDFQLYMILAVKMGELLRQQDHLKGNKVCNAFTPVVANLLLHFVETYIVPYKWQDSTFSSLLQSDKKVLSEYFASLLMNPPQQLKIELIVSMHQFYGCLAGDKPAATWRSTLLQKKCSEGVDSGFVEELKIAVHKLQGWKANAFDMNGLLLQILCVCAPRTTSLAVLKGLFKVGNLDHLPLKLEGELSSMLSTLLARRLATISNECALSALWEEFQTSFGKEAMSVFLRSAHPHILNSFCPTELLKGLALAPCGPGISSIVDPLGLEACIVVENPSSPFDELTSKQLFAYVCGVGQMENFNASDLKVYVRILEESQQRKVVTEMTGAGMEHDMERDYTTFLKKFLEAGRSDAWCNVVSILGTPHLQTHSSATTLKVLKTEAGHCFGVAMAEKIQSAGVLFKCFSNLSGNETISKAIEIAAVKLMENVTDRNRSGLLKMPSGLCSSANPDTAASFWALCAKRFASREKIFESCQVMLLLS